MAEIVWPDQSHRIHINLKKKNKPCETVHKPIDSIWFGAVCECDIGSTEITMLARI